MTVDERITILANFMVDRVIEDWKNDRLANRKLKKRNKKKLQQ